MSDHPPTETPPAAPRGAEPGAARDPWLRFALLFAVLAVGSELLYYGVALESGLFQRYLAALARISGWILSPFADDVSVRGTLVTSPFFSVEIGRGCDAYRICALLTAAMLAFPARLGLKLAGIALGLLWLNLWNFVRIIGLFYIGGTFHAQFRDAHEVYFPVFLIVMTVAAWVVWVRRATRELRGSQPTPA